MACSIPLQEQRGVQLSAGDGPVHLRGHAATNGSGKKYDSAFAGSGLDTIYKLFRFDRENEAHTGGEVPALICKYQLLRTINQAGNSD